MKEISSNSTLNFKPIDSFLEDEPKNKVGQRGSRDWNQHPLLVNAINVFHQSWLQFV
jgi:hypothetical protein